MYSVIVDLSSVATKTIFAANALFASLMSPSIFTLDVVYVIYNL